MLGDIGHDLAVVIEAEKQATLVPLTEITGPMQRKLNEAAMRRLLQGMRDGSALPPIIVYRAQGSMLAMLLDGLHRVRISRALGFTSIPATLVSREDAEGGFGYQPPAE